MFYDNCVLIFLYSRNSHSNVCGMYAAEVARALQETEHLLGEISVMTRQQSPAVEQCAKVLSSLEGVVEHEVSSLSRYGKNHIY